MIRNCFLLQQQGINPVSSAAKGKVVSYNVDLSLASDEVFVLHHWQPVNLQLSAFLPTTFVAAGTTIKCDIVTEAL